jgi:hypothetical protein
MRSSTIVPRSLFPFSKCMWKRKFWTHPPGVWIHAPIIDLHAELATLPPDHPIGSVILKLFQLWAFPSPLKG